MKNDYYIKQLSTFEVQDFTTTLNIYTNLIPPKIRTSSNEIIDWIDEYNIIFEDELLIFSLCYKKQIIGFFQAVYFKKEMFLVIDYIVIEEQYRKNNTLKKFIFLIEDFFKNYCINFVVIEIILENNKLHRFLKQKRFKEVQKEYFHPNMEFYHGEEHIEAKLLYLPIKDNTLTVDLEELIINTIYRKHYLRWYKKDTINLNINESIDNKSISTFYDNLDSIWSENDNWHFYTFKEIKKFIKENIYINNIDNNIKLLNAGSGGNEYNIKCNKHIHIDLSKKNISNKENYIIGSIEDIPLANKTMDFILCVGSVINYTDALRSIQEFNRIMKPNAFLILEFESSQSFEYIFTKAFKKNAKMITTFYKNKEEKIWVFSNSYMYNILKQNNFRIIKKHNFHIVSSLIYRLTKNDNFASLFAKWDKLFNKIPFIKNYSSNTILICQKI